jgi:hypothetical protein
MSYSTVANICGQGSQEIMIHDCLADTALYKPLLHTRLFTFSRAD